MVPNELPNGRLGNEEKISQWSITCACQKALNSHLIGSQERFRTPFDQNRTAGWPGVRVGTMPISSIPGQVQEQADAGVAQPVWRLGNPLWTNPEHAAGLPRPSGTRDGGEAPTQDCGWSVCSRTSCGIWCCDQRRAFASSATRRAHRRGAVGFPRCPRNRQASSRESGLLTRQARAVHGV